jgi:hypothetical protein
MIKDILRVKKASGFDLRLIKEDNTETFVIIKRI